MAVTQTQNPIVSDPLKAAMDAIANGKDAAEAVYGPGANMDDAVEVVSESGNPLDNIEESEQSTELEQSESTSKSSKTSPTPLEAQVTEISNSTSPANSGSIEELFVKGPDGKRQSIKIDYENKEAIKQAHLKAAGMRKFQAERDQERKSSQQLKAELDKFKSDFEKLESLYKNGAKSLFMGLGGEEEWNKAVDAELKQRQYIASLTPEERYRVDLQKQNEVAQKQKSEVETKYQKMLETLEQKEDLATQKSLESKLHPSFDRYRFAGKLADPVVEHQLDETIWNQVTRKLAEYPDHVELSQALIDKEFRTVSQNLQKVINVQAEKKVTQTVEKKKVEAAKTAQFVAKKGLANTGEKDKFIENVRSGNIVDAMKAMASGKVRL